jgi:hypothetical protein
MQITLEALIKRSPHFDAKVSKDLRKSKKEETR